MECKAGQVAYITGGASGIGLGIAKALAGTGMKIALADIEEDALGGAVEELRGGGADVRPFVVDVSNRDALAASRDAALDAFGAVHLVFNNAGVNCSGSIDELSYDDWDWVMGVNLGGVINGVMTFVPELVRHGADAHIVNTASIGGLLGMPGLAIYNTAKFGVVGLSEALRADFQSMGVNVSVLCPGLTRTNLATSERNRPGNEKATIEKPAGSPIEMGMDPDLLGQKVLQAVRANEFFICPHPEFREVLRKRNAALEAAFKGSAPPGLVAAINGLVEPF